MADQLDRWLEALEQAATVMTDHAAGLYLSSPVVPPERKQAMLTELLPNVPPTAHNFLGILAHRDQLDLIPEIARVFQRLVNEHRDIRGRPGHDGRPDRRRPAGADRVALRAAPRQDDRPGDPRRPGDPGRRDRPGRRRRDRRECARSAGAAASAAHGLAASSGISGARATSQQHDIGDIWGRHLQSSQEAPRIFTSRQLEPDS